MTAKRPSMQDVADLAGVSRTTVSFILNKVEIADNFSPETRERVLAAAAKLNYRRNLIAGSLRSQKTQTIGFISDMISATAFTGHIIQGAKERAWENKHLLLLVDTDRNQVMKETAVNALIDRQVDGIIFATVYHREAHPPENIREVPTVLLNCFVQDRSLPSVVPDEVKGGYDATLHLLQKGHRRIGFICDESGVPATVGRFTGYKQALAEFDVPFDPDLTVFHGESIARHGYHGAMVLMQHEQPPTALFCYTDRMAMGAYDALRTLNLSIPNDVAVVGFDNQEFIAAELYPGLTTMELPHYEMGDWAVKHLLELIEQQRQGMEQVTSPQQLLLECPLIERLST